jgi:deoxyribonuclease V
MPVALEIPKSWYDDTGESGQLELAREAQLCYSGTVGSSQVSFDTTNLAPMTIRPAVSHSWDVDPERAKDIQLRLRERVVTSPSGRRPGIVGGVDVSVRAGQARAAVVLLSFPELEPLEAATAEAPVTFPYIPGLLAFREGHVVLEAIGRLEKQPDVLIFDGHGLAHPRRMGLATHLGVLLDMPSVGCAKSRLCGEHDEPDTKKGSWTELRDDNEVVGAVVRTRSLVRPVFVSIGHRVDLETAVKLVIDCSPRYRLPETTRWAHRVAGGGSLLRAG